MSVRALCAALLVLTATFASAAASPYVRPEQVNLTRLLAPPPASDNGVAREDVRMLLRLQEERTPEMVAQARADVERGLVRFSDAVGTDLSKSRAPLANGLIDKASASIKPIVDGAKAFWHRPRPYVAEAKITPALPREETFSYPSGHSTYGMMVGIILANMLPEKADALFARGVQYGFERVVGGVHYPSDVAAGRFAATVLTALMMDDPGFQKDFAAATAEVRGLLDLPPLPANDMLPAGALVVPAATAAASAR